MKRVSFIVAIVAGFLLFGAKTAFALNDFCDATPGAPGTGECQITTPHSVTGTFQFDRTVHIYGGGRIDATNGGITLNICVAPAPVFATCDFLIDSPSVMNGGQTEADDPTSPPTSSASDITVKVSRNVVMQAGSAILADNFHAGGHPGNITITAGGDMTMCGPAGAQPGCGGPSANDGAEISAQNRDTNAYTPISVTITVGDQSKGTGNFYMEGGNTTYGAETGALIDTTVSAGHAGNIDVTAGKSYFTEPGAVIQAGGHDHTATAQGGKIFLVSDCGLTSEGRVTSKGPDFGADLVHLESCEVIIRGLVESTGKGHNAAAANSCDNINDGLPGEVLRNHPAVATGCIEVWGNFITIDSTVNANVHWAGELNADIGDGGPQGASWIDIFANSKLTVIDGTGNDRVSDNFGHTYFSVYAVHANMIDGSDSTPGVITALVKNGPLTASGDGEANGGKAFEASTTLTADTGHYSSPTFIGNGSDGGTIDLEASGTVTLDSTWVNASGDFGPGTQPLGGHITVKAWGAGSNISWKAVDGDVQPDATGTITLGACNAIDTTGTNFHGEVPATSTGGANCDPTQPTIPTITPANRGPVFKTDLWAACSTTTISGKKFDDKNGNHVNDGEPGLDGWVIHLFNASGTVHMTQTTAGGGLYTFAGVPAGTYTICEQLQSGPPAWQQTFPTAGADCVTPGDPAGDNPTPGPLGYTVTVAACCDAGSCAPQPITGKDFGNIQLAIKTGTKFNDVAGDHKRDLPQDVGLNGWVIHLFGTAVDGSTVHKTTTTAGSGSATGSYSFTVLPGSYDVCEQLQATWTQTFPTAGHACTTAEDPDNPTPGPIGYAIVLTEGQTDPGNDFGNNSTTPPLCPEDPTRASLLTRTVDLSKPNLSGGGVPNNPKNYWLVQAAYNDAKASGQSEVIGMFSNTNENLLLDGSKSLTITQCTSARVTGTAASPVWNITSTGKLTIIGPDAVGGSVGWSVGGNGGHTLKSIRANGAKTNGVLITTNANSVSWNDVSGNGSGAATDAGIRVTGGTNILKGSTIGSNNGDGVQLVGNSNNLSGATIQSNKGHGVLVSGSTNTVQSNSLLQNVKNGALVSGSTNTLSSNSSDSGKGNGMNGIQVSSGTANVLSDNKMNSNKNAGIDVAAGSSKLKSNANTSNTGNEFTIGANNTDQSNNKSNGNACTFTAAAKNCN